MTYEELNEMVKDWQNVGNLRVATENGNTSLHSDTGITPTLARNIIASIWNELPRLFEEARVLVDDHERMSWMFCASSSRFPRIQCAVHPG